MKRVLVVDDEPVIRALVVASLAGDCKVSAAADGKDAIASLQNETPDLILLDVGLPGMSGGEDLRQIRSDAKTTNVPVLLLTGIEPPEELEPDGVVLKPFTPITLRASLAGWLTD
jgi:two-component system phosphate regulon response regulator PhoB